MKSHISHVKKMRLRKKRYELSQANPNDDIKLQKGKLLHNATIVDKFDLNNQIF